ncbi:hypothetical protein PLICRDRAFT_126753 [Plicaturopsis crispa FD-325 SS-3]|uniref:Unplaced genomic scaffold PLICRscaffold_16, whole genome shotgun sequence n=1 Tax=Plicaturopsis crispa FD-325 SS-3 TaxID=944288 RepID=A0A0C9T6L4_PLICR|nr:hypothetical protein PLICRDRAFT_126753 [Plicaturopsis crispa FD-325 SS-3]
MYPATPTGPPYGPFRSVTVEVTQSTTWEYQTASGGRSASRRPALQAGHASSHWAASMTSGGPLAMQPSIPGPDAIYSAQFGPPPPSAWLANYPENPGVIPFLFNPPDAVPMPAYGYPPLPSRPSRRGIMHPASSYSPPSPGSGYDSDTDEGDESDDSMSEGTPRCSPELLSPDAARISESGALLMAGSTPYYQPGTRPEGSPSSGRTLVGSPSQDSDHYTSFPGRSRRDRKKKKASRFERMIAAARGL